MTVAGPRLFAPQLELAFWLSQLLLVVATAAGILALVSQQRALKWVVHTHQVIEQLERIGSTMKDAETGQRGFLLTGEPSYLVPYADAEAAVDAQLQRLATLIADNHSQLRSLAGLRETIDAKRNTMADALRLYRDGRENAAIKYVRSGRGAALMRQLREQIAGMRAAEDRLLANRTREASLYRVAGWSAVGTIAALALTLLWVMRYIARRDQARIRASEERLATTLASIGDGVIATDRHGRVERMNRAAEQMTGWSTATAVGRPIDEVFDLRNELSRERLDSPVGDVLRNGHVSKLASSALLISSEGHEYAIEDSAAPIRGIDQSLHGVVLVFHDVTERRRAEEARLRGERHYRQVLESLPQLVWTCDSDGKAQFLSRQWLSYTGGPLELDRGFGWSRHIHADDRERLLALWERAVKEGREFDTETRIRGVDGQYRWFKQRAVPLKQPNGATSEWFGTSTDITDLVEAREDVRRANALLERRVEERTVELQEINLELQAFAHSVAHDLRAPLRNIQGYASAILEDERPRLSEEGVLYAERMADSAVRLDRLIQDLLAYSRLSRAEIILQRIDLGALVERVLGDMSTELAAREARVTIDSELPPVIAQGPILGQVLTNVLSNAVKFVPLDVLPDVHIAGAVRDDRVRVSISDNGIGIAREHQERIFGVFERLHGSEQYPGTGIGLAIVRRGTERLGGRVWIESSPGAGSRFYIELRAG